MALYCGGQGAQYFSKQLVYACVGSVILICFYFCDYKQIERFSPLILGIGVVLIEATILFGPHINGKPRFLPIFPFIFYTSNLAMPFLVIGYIGFVRRWARPRIRNFIFLVLLASIPSLMMVQISSWPTGIATGAIFIIIQTLYIIGKEYKGNKVKTLCSLYGALVPIGTLLLFMGIYSRAYLIDRFHAFLNQKADPKGNGYLYSVLLYIRKGAKLVGGTSYFKQVDPDGGWFAADAIFTFLVGSMGWIMGGILLITLALIIIRLFRTAFKVQEGYGRLLALSIACIFAAQYILNIAMNLGYVPIVTTSLSFVSYGGSRLIPNMTLLGLFMSTYRRKDLIHIPHKVWEKSEWLNKIWKQMNQDWSFSCAGIGDIELEEEIREEGIAIGREQGTVEVAKNLIGILEDEVIAEKTGLSLEQVNKLKIYNNQ